MGFFGILFWDFVIWGFVIRDFENWECDYWEIVPNPILARLDKQILHRLRKMPCEVMTVVNVVHISDEPVFVIVHSLAIEHKTKRYGYFCSAG